MFEAIWKEANGLAKELENQDPSIIYSSSPSRAVATNQDTTTLNQYEDAEPLDNKDKHLKCTAGALRAPSLCTSCIEYVPPNLLIHLPCVHRYCIPYITEYLKATLTTGSTFPPKCCGRPITLHNFEGQIPLDLAASYPSKEEEKVFLISLYCAKRGSSVPTAEGNIEMGEDIANLVTTIPASSADQLGNKGSNATPTNNA